MHGSGGGNGGARAGGDEGKWCCGNGLETGPRMRWPSRFIPDRDRDPVTRHVLDVPRGRTGVAPAAGGGQRNLWIRGDRENESDDDRATGANLRGSPPLGVVARGGPIYTEPALQDPKSGSRVAMDPCRRSHPGTRSRARICRFQDICVAY